MVGGCDPLNVITEPASIGATKTVPVSDTYATVNWVFNAFTSSDSVNCPIKYTTNVGFITTSTSSLYVYSLATDV